MARDDAPVVTVEVGIVESLEFSEFWAGDDQPVLDRAAGQLHVGVLSVQPVEADGDRLIPGAALGSVCGECVGVGDVPAAV